MNWQIAWLIDAFSFSLTATSQYTEGFYWTFKKGNYHDDGELEGGQDEEPFNYRNDKYAVLLTIYAQTYF